MRPFYQVQAGLMYLLYIAGHKVVYRVRVEREMCNIALLCIFLDQST